jgi:MipA family protein
MTYLMSVTFVATRHAPHADGTSRLAIRRLVRTFVTLAGGPLLASALCMPVAHADELALPAEGTRSGLGLGVGVERKPYRDIKNDSTALPLLFYENRWVSLQGNSLDLKLPSVGPLTFGLRALYSGDGYEADDSPFLVGMAERKDGLWMGVVATWRSDLANVSAELLGDASGNSKGQKFKVSAEHGFKSGAFEFTPRVAAVWLDSKYVGYYYGVNASEARAARVAYDGKATVNMEAGLRTSYALAPQQLLFLDLSVTALGQGIKDSPLVDRSSQTGLRVGYVYRF